MDLLTFWSTHKVLLTIYFVIVFFQPLRNIVIPILIGKLFQRLQNGESVHGPLYMLMGFVVVSELVWFLGHYLENIAHDKISKTDNPQLYGLINMLKNMVIPSIVSMFGVLVTLFMFDIDLALLFSTCLTVCLVIYYKYRNKFVLLPFVLCFVYISLSHIKNIQKNDSQTKAITLVTLDYMILNNTVMFISLFPSHYNKKDQNVPKQS